MGNKLIIMKDYHARLEEPFYSAQIDFENWIEKQPWNNENNYFLQLGDLYHFYNPSPKVHAHIISLFQNKLRFKKKIIIAGNNTHEYNRAKKVNVTEAVSQLVNVELDIKPAIRDLEGFKFLTMPWFYDDIYKELGKLKDFYSNMPEKYTKIKYDYIFGHLEDETINFGSEIGIDLSYINTNKRLLGHIHLKRKNYNLGMPIISRYDEKGESNELLEIDLETKEERIIEVPKFIDYYNVEYDKELVDEEYEAKYKMFVINNCPDKSKTELEYRHKYKNNKNFYFHKFEVKKMDKTNDINNILDISDINKLSKLDLLNKYFEDNNLNLDIQDKVKSLITLNDNNNNEE